MFERYISKLMLTPKTTLGALVFDCYASVQHSSDSTITSHPVQSGANINDHKYRQPETLVYQIKMSDVCKDLVEGQFYKNGEGSILDNIVPSNLWQLSKEKLEAIKKDKSLNLLYGNSRSVNAYRILQTIKNSNAIFGCATRLKYYENMTIKSIQASDDNTTAFGLSATVVMQEVLPAQIQQVKVSAKSHTTQTTNKGVQTAKPLESIIYQKGGLVNAILSPF